MGLAAVMSLVRVSSRYGKAAPLVLLLLTGCTSAGSIAGAVTGAASGTGSANPALGYAVGIGTKAAVDALSHYISRQRQGAEQDRIATAVGTLPVGQTVAWRIRHKIPLFDDQHGYVTVVRDIPNALTPCKEVVFTVLVGKKVDSPRGHYVTTACEQDTRWKWAQAEPATTRWGFLQ
jgi:hypothetical protein